MMPPDFLILGAQKAGTTWLASRLSEHPGIFMPPREIHYFDVPSNFAKGREWYYRHFEPAKDDQVSGEKTPDYLWTNRPDGIGCPRMVEEIYNLVPDAKLVILLRDPVRRVISAVNHQIAAGKLSPFVDVDDLLIGENAEMRMQFGFLERGHYAEQIREFRSAFGDGAMKILVYEEDIVKKPEKTLAALFEFLGVNTEFKPRNISNTENRGLKSRTALVLNYYLPIAAPVISGLDRLLPAGQPAKPSQETVKRLYSYFEGANKDLEQLLGRSLGAWRG